MSTWKCRISRERKVRNVNIPRTSNEHKFLPLGQNEQMLQNARYLDFKGKTSRSPNRAEISSANEAQIPAKKAQISAKGRKLHV